MKKQLLRINLLLFLSLFMVSCGAKKKTSRGLTTSEKLEIQFQKFKGIPYKYGGTTRKGFDCSGFVNAVYINAFNIDLPRVTYDIAKEGSKVSKSKLKPGDLVFFRPSRKYMHMGIYVGNGEFMHSSTSKGVIKSRMDNVYWKKKYKFSRRILRN